MNEICTDIVDQKVFCNYFWLFRCNAETRTSTVRFRCGRPWNHLPITRLLFLLCRNAQCVLGISAQEVEHVKAGSWWPPNEHNTKGLGALMHTSNEVTQRCPQTNSSWTLKYQFPGWQYHAHGLWRLAYCQTSCQRCRGWEKCMVRIETPDKTNWEIHYGCSARE